MRFWWPALGKESQGVGATALVRWVKFKGVDIALDDEWPFSFGGRPLNATERRLVGTWGPAERSGLLADSVQYRLRFDAARRLSMSDRTGRFEMLGTWGATTEHLIIRRNLDLGLPWGEIAEIAAMNLRGGQRSLHFRDADHMITNMAKYIRIPDELD